MCNFEGETRQLLTIPPDFVPYMEKHRLYEFFYVIELHRVLSHFNISFVISRRIVLYHKKFVGICDAITDPAARRPNSIYETMRPPYCSKTGHSQNYPYSSSKLR